MVFEGLNACGMVQTIFVREWEAVLEKRASLVCVLRVEWNERVDGSVFDREVIAMSDTS